MLPKHPVCITCSPRYPLSCNKTVHALVGLQDQYLKHSLNLSYFTPTNMAIINKKENNKCWRCCGKIGISALLMGM